MRYPHIIIASLLTLGLTGCVRNPEVHSARSPDYTGSPHRIFIAASFGETFEIHPAWSGTPITKERDEVKEKLTSALDKCGIASDMEFVQSLSFHIAIDKKVKEFSPDSILSIQWTTALTKNGNVFHPSFHVALTDLASRVIVWNENITVNGSVQLPQEFVNGIVNQMIRDRILPSSCFIEAPKEVVQPTPRALPQP